MDDYGIRLRNGGVSQHDWPMSWYRYNPTYLLALCVPNPAPYNEILYKINAMHFTASLQEM